MRGLRFPARIAQWRPGRPQNTSLDRLHIPGSTNICRAWPPSWKTPLEPSIEPHSDAPPPVLQNPQRALEHYDQLLVRNPGSFWGHYRAAVVCFRMKQWSLAAGHLDRCLQRRSKNSSVRGQYAACLGELGLLDSAIVECSQALSMAPDHAEFYRSRVFLRAWEDGRRDSKRTWSDSRCSAGT